ncbi:hypothetical protein PLICBS_003632 [Purpureocillium lilacinum]|uniref:uncharacterized protein n=1 Tax=Purpureocillium lilacinum TaxID=33203 RepID=UPI00208B08B1|nr:hypothetical protein PLICBS_003632 [Purpureocillium lilacinum]
MPFQSLPTEILGMILRSIDTPKDLDAAVRAYSTWFRIFHTAPARTLSEVLRNSVHPAIIGDMIVAAKCPRIGRVLGTDFAKLYGDYTADIVTFTEDLLQNQPRLRRCPEYMPGLTSLSRLIVRTSLLADDFFRRAISALARPRGGCANNNEDGNSFAPVRREFDNLSHTERARLQRAFARLETYIEVFSSFNPRGREQSRQILQNLEPWEVEEMSCVYHHFVQKLGKKVCEEQDRLVDRVLGHHSTGVDIDDEVLVATECGDGFSIRSVNSQKNEMTTFEPSKDHSFMLFFFSRDYNSSKLADFDGIISRGMGDLWDLCVKLEQGGESCPFRKITGSIFASLPETIDRLASPLVDTVRPKLSDFTDHPSQPNMGYYAFKRSTNERYLGVYRSDSWAVRTMGYVFWDLDRLRQPVVWAKLREASKMTGDHARAAYDPSLHTSAEEKLQGIRVSVRLMEELSVEEYRDRHPSSYNRIPLV